MSNKVNKHIPRYISTVPWYTNDDDDGDGLSAGAKGPGADYLAHHRKSGGAEDNSQPKVGAGINDEFVVARETVKITNTQRKLKFGKGCCTNCGSKDHGRKDCLEKPRKFGKRAFEERKSEQGFKRNEDVDYDSKRDRWFGYDVQDYQKLVNNWEEKKKLKDMEDAKAREGMDIDSDVEIEMKELGLWDELKDGVFKDSEKQEGEKIVRLLEDKAVYLNDIRQEKITYDPKSRTVRDDDTGYVNERNLFVRHLTGEAKEFENTKKFAWDEKRRGIIENNHVANPTLSGIKIKKESEEERKRNEQLKKTLFSKYGNFREEGEEESGSSDGESHDSDGHF